MINVLKVRPLKWAAYLFENQTKYSLWQEEKSVMWNIIMIYIASTSLGVWTGLNLELVGCRAFILKQLIYIIDITESLILHAWRKALLETSLEILSLVNNCIYFKVWEDIAICNIVKIIFTQFFIFLLLSKGRGTWGQWDEWHGQRTNNTQWNFTHSHSSAFGTSHSTLQGHAAWKRGMDLYGIWNNA